MPGFEQKINARKLIRDNSPKIFLISIIFIILSTVMSELQFRLPGTMDVYDQYVQQLLTGEKQSLSTIYSYFRPSGVPFAVVLWFLSVVLDTGLKSYCLKTSRKQKGDHKDLFDGFLFFGKVILIQIISSIFIMMWSFLFIIPGIIAFYKYRQAYYILLDDPKKSALQCISESKHMMHGKKLDLFLLDLSFIGWLFLDYLVVIIMPLPFSLPIVSILLTPYFGLTCAGFYNQLINRLAV